MAQGFILQQGIQDGSFNLNDNQVTYSIRQNLDNERYFIDMYIDDQPIILGKYLENGTDLLYNKEHLGLGVSLTFRGNDDLSEAYLVYERV